MRKLQAITSNFKKKSSVADGFLSMLRKFRIGEFLQLYQIFQDTNLFRGNILIL